MKMLSLKNHRILELILFSVNIIKYAMYKDSSYCEDKVEGSVVFLRWDVLRNKVWPSGFNPTKFRMKLRKCRKANKIVKLLHSPWKGTINVIIDKRPKNRNQLLNYRICSWKSLI